MEPRLDRAEYLALQAAAGWSAAVELIDGEAVVSPPSGGQAASAQGELFFAIRRWQESTGDRWLLQDVFVRLAKDDYLAPDLAWWSAARRPRLAAGALHIIPDLVIEVLSPATGINDLEAKRDIYLAVGIRELGLVDPQLTAVTTVAENGDQRLAEPGSELMSPLLPGLRIELARIFQT